MRSRVFALVGILVGLFLALQPALRLWPWPEYEAFCQQPFSRTLYSAEGKLLAIEGLEEGLQRQWVALEDVPAHTLRIFIAAEDRRFYRHWGIDALAVLRSAYINLRSGSVKSGASTIGMQLARIIHGKKTGLSAEARLNAKAGLALKAGEAFRAVQLQALRGKKGVLEAWLNCLPFGSNIEGLASIAQRRFSCKPQALGIEQSLLLALIPRSPSHYDFFYEKNRERAVAAALQLAKRAGYSVSEAELLRVATALTGQAVESATRQNPAPHFIRETFRRNPAFFPLQNKDRSAEKLGDIASQLDLALQKEAEKQLGMAILEYSDRRIQTGAILVLENASGQVLSWVGSHDFWDDGASGQIDGVLAKNQSGSTIKPFLYALALERGLVASEILPDIPTVFGSEYSYFPMNFDRHFNGPTRLRVALASSLNVPAVYLLQRLSVKAFEDWLIDLGFYSIVAQRGSNGLALALGSCGISLEELTRGFAILANSGCKPGSGEQLISKETAWLIKDMLSDADSRYKGFGSSPSMQSSLSLMFKTGTAQQFQHIWALAASPKYTVGVWMGSFQGSTVRGQTGSSVPAYIARNILEYLHDTSPWPKRPESLVPLEICAVSGLLAKADCPHRLIEYLPFSANLSPCTWHRGKTLLLPDTYRAWAADRQRLVQIGGERTGANIRRPLAGSVFYIKEMDGPSTSGENVSLGNKIRLETTGFAEGAEVYLDGQLYGQLDATGRLFLPAKLGNTQVVVEDRRGQRLGTNYLVRN